MTKRDIVAGLRELGLIPGDKVLVHSSVAAVGPVEGGPEAVIDALLEAVGPEGLVVVPTFASPRPFDRRSSPTGLGVLPDLFWRRPGAVRSLHPTHSVAAIGRGAEALLRGHEQAPTAYAEGTPYHALALTGGKILLLGVDQDRNTTLHAAEALAKAAYLKDITASYLDDVGQEVTIPVAAMAGPHRDFLGLDARFRAAGVMTTGRIGQAVCRLLDTGGMLRVALEALRDDPAAVLCDNPACRDCVRQRGQIKAARLAEESFTLAAVAEDISDDWAEMLLVLRGEGIAALETGVDAYRRFERGLAESGIHVSAIRGGLTEMEAAALARSLAVPLIVPVSTEADLATATELARGGTQVLLENRGLPSKLLFAAYTASPETPGLAFNPGQFAAVGEHPFLSVFTQAHSRRHTRRFYVDDATWDGQPALPGRGNGEVKEIISMLRCRSFDGAIALRSHHKGVAALREVAAAFWRLLDTM